MISLSCRYIHDGRVSRNGLWDLEKDEEELIERNDKIKGYQRMVEISRLRCLVRFPLLVTLPRTQELWSCYGNHQFRDIHGNVVSDAK